jgi:hypothetical protein
MEISNISSSLGEGILSLGLLTLENKYINQFLGVLVQSSRQGYQFNILNPSDNM